MVGSEGGKNFNRRKLGTRAGRHITRSWSVQSGWSNNPAAAGWERNWGWRARLIGFTNMDTDAGRRNPSGIGVVKRTGALTYCNYYWIYFKPPFKMRLG